MKPISLRWRIRLLVTLVVMTVVTAVSATSYLRFRTAYLGHIDRMLEIMSKGILTELDEPQDPRELADKVRLITDSPWRGPETHFRLWVEGDDADLAASVPARGKKAPFLWDLQDVGPPEGEAPVFFSLTDKKKHFRALWTRHAGAYGNVNILVAHPSSFEHRRLNELLVMLLVVGGGLILAGATLGAWLVLLGLRPLGAAASRLAGITDANLGKQHLSDLAVPTELEPVVHEVACLLERLDAALAQQKQFVADASHELRTPLTLAQSTLQLANSKDRGVPEYRKAVEETLADLDRMEWLIHQLLTLARIDRLGRVPEPVDLCLDAMLQELAIEHHARASEHGGEVVATDLAPCVVHGNEEMLALLFSNLLDNAITYGPPGGTVRIGLEYGPDACCTAAIQDEGGNIPPEAMPHLFDRFYRVESSRHRNTGGAGLGLAIARQVAVQHGGDLWATSTPGTSTTFHVRLPCERRCDDLPAGGAV
ncbi:MAG: hypothetical protein AMS14_11125 [Planctomycetes bacterium DG_20]|nr:MAG: hypothetical protein AMS14_11125 [Planctomycetes bacterium DG_20]